ncbi:hypothetical protein SO802_016309 [Lithocarpus litseifolius]|uniref:(+)-neomenthol dehydrogenase n=1 Tax=Lithocarpus litseifolius TaxID=425828 RepID=A0AAW2CYQ0_9ROSI
MWYAVVTGSNKGIGLETVRQLALKGVKVVLTARDEKKGLEVVQKLKDSGLSNLVLFHQLDVGSPASIASLPDFINTWFRRLDVLVEERPQTQRRNTMIQTYESMKEYVETNYYGAKRTAEVLIPLLQLSHSPTIVNVFSSAGKMSNIANEWARGVFTNPNNLTEENVEEVLSEFLKDFKEGSLETKGWGHSSSAYVLSKAALNAYTKILAKRYPSFCINCVYPGFVKIDINCNTGKVPVEEGAAYLQQHHLKLLELVTYWDLCKGLVTDWRFVHQEKEVDIAGGSEWVYSISLEYKGVLHLIESLSRCSCSNFSSSMAKEAATRDGHSEFFFFIFIFFVLVNSDDDDIDADYKDGEWIPQVQHLKVLARERNGDRKVRAVRFFHCRQSTLCLFASFREYRISFETKCSRTGSVLEAPILSRIWPLVLRTSSSSSCSSGCPWYAVVIGSNKGIGLETVR